MYTGLFHTHKLTITIFILLYLIKTILLLSGRNDSLVKFSNKLLPFEIFVSSLFLITGVWLLFETGEIRTLFIVKLVVVAVAVPMALIGFRKPNKTMAILSFLLIISAYGMAEMNKKTMVKRMELPRGIVVDENDAKYSAITHGKALFEAQCVVCHGEEGNLQMSGAKDLTVSEMTKEEVIERVKEGKLTMISYEDYFSPLEIEAVSEYVMSLRKE